MRRADEKVLKALSNLESNPDFRVIREWFLESQSDQDRTLRTSDNPTLIHRAQGAIKEHLEFSELSSSPRELLRRLNGPKQAA